MLTDLLQTQIVTQSLWGTQITTKTVKLAGNKRAGVKFQPNTVAEVLPEERGSLAPSDKVNVLSHDGAATFDFYGIYEHLNYHLESLLGVVTPTGAGPYVRQGAAPLTAIPTNPRRYTMYRGDGTSGYQLTGALCTEILLKGTAKGYIEGQAKYLAQQQTTGSPTALADASVNTMLGAHSALYIDTWAGTIGSTAITDTNFAWELKLTSNRALDTYLGSLTPADWNENSFDGELKLSVIYNATTSPYADIMMQTGGTVFQRQVRINIANGANLIQRLDFAGSAEKAPVWGDERNGLVSIDVVLKKTYNSTLGNWFKYSNTCQVSALA